jgi:predicted membrane metal-binding protein
VVDDFRGSGLTHLLVVSGQNLAFVLVLASPVTNRLTWRWRWVVTLGVIGAFALVTRFEPSVLRASAMAAICWIGEFDLLSQAGLLQGQPASPALRPTAAGRDAPAGRRLP